MKGVEVHPTNLPGMDARQTKVMSETMDVAFKRLPSPLKASLFGAGAGLFVGLFAGHPVKYSVIGAGLTFLGAIALESAFMTGVTYGCAECSIDHLPKSGAPSAKPPTMTGAEAWRFEVFRAQTLLARIGYAVPTNGTLDAKTTEALKQFQTTYSLQRTDGTINPETMAYLQMAAKQREEMADPMTGLHQTTSQTA